MNQIPVLPSIETERLILLIPTPSDAARMIDYFKVNKDHLADWEPRRLDEHFTLAYWSKHLTASIDQFISGESLWLMLLDRNNPAGAILGQCRFTQITRGVFQAAYLGYSLDRHAVGKGLMYEALMAAIEYAFERMNLHRIMANYMPRNERSARLLRRLGFTVEGYARDYLRLAGRWEDHILTSLVNEEWTGD